MVNVVPLLKKGCKYKIGTTNHYIRGRKVTRQDSEEQDLFAFGSGQALFMDDVSQI